MTPIFLLVGPPAVGKSTTSRALAQRFPLGVHIPVDDLRMMVVSGLALPATEWSDSLARQVSLARGVAAHMALSYHAAGFAVVIDDFWDLNHPTDYAALIGQPALRRAVLFPDQAEAHRRNLARSGEGVSRDYIDQGIRDVYARLNPVIGRLAAEGWMIADTTTLTVEETVDRLIDT